jgi:hypothetical protein
MWSLSKGRFKKPHMPMFNWEELGKVSPDLLRTMRHITFGKYNSSYDGAYFGNKKKMYGNQNKYLHELDEEYKVYDVKRRWTEEWPSEIFNYQDRFPLKSLKSMKVMNLDKGKAPVSEGDEDTESPQMLKVSKEQLKKVLTSVNGIGEKKFNKIIEEFGSTQDVVGILEQTPSILMHIKGISSKIIKQIESVWTEFKGKN